MSVIAAHANTTCNNANAFYAAHSTPGYAPQIAPAHFSAYTPGPSPVVGGYSQNKTLWFGNFCAGSATGEAGKPSTQYQSVLECPDNTASTEVDQYTPGASTDRKLTLCVAFNK